MILIVANIGTAVVLFPILRRQNETLALGYVTARVMECVFIAVGLVSLLAVVTLRQDVGAAGGESVVTAGRTLVAIHDWTFLLACCSASTSPSRDSNRLRSSPTTPVPPESVRARPPRRQTRRRIPWGCRCNESLIDH